VLGTATDAPAGASFDPGELLDVDVDELTRPRALVADWLLESESAELAHPAPGQNPRHRRERHPERLRDLGRCKAKPTQLRDHLHTVMRGAIRDMPRRRGVITQTGQTVEPVAPDPLTSATDAHTRSRSRRDNRPTFINHELAEPSPASPTESGVSVQVHPVTSLGPSCL
jgi:hypothetical protein